MSGVLQYARQEWGIVAADLVNPTDQTVLLLALSNFDAPTDGSATPQFGREFWLPPNSRRRSWYPVLPPTIHRRETSKIAIHSTLWNRTGGTDVKLQPPGEELLHTQILPVYLHPNATSLVHPFADQGLPGTEQYRSASELPDDIAFEASVSLRLADRSFPTRRVSQYRSENLPPTAESWRALDRIILADDRIAEDAAGLVSLRRWVFEGGWLWVMLDQSSATTLERLFGDVLECQEIDRIGLTDVTIVNHRGRTETRPDVLQFDDPVNLVRVAVSGVDVHHTVDGWPASFWKDAGKGRILVTTLEPRAWVRLRTQKDPLPRETDIPESPPKYTSIPSLAQLADEFFVPNENSNVDTDDLKPLLMEQIGYRIVSRGPVAAVLGLFCGSLLVGGVWLLRREQLERLVWIGPVGVAVASVILVALGLRSSRAVPNTTAFTQIVQAVPGSDDVVADGVLALYNQTETTSPIGAQRGGTFEPDITAIGGAFLRRVWTDIDAWHWENLPIPGGVRTANFQFSGKLPEPIIARGTFGPEGFSGRLASGRLAGMSDAVVMHGVQPGCAVRLDAEGRFAATSADLLDHGEFLKGTLLSDEQRRRQETYRQLFPDVRQDASAGLQGSIATEARKQRYPVSRPALFVWSDPVPMRFSFPDSARSIGSALLHIPLVIDRPPVGTDVVIPTTFLSCTDVLGPEANQGSMATFDSSTGELKSTSSNLTWLEFKVPEELRPLKVTGARLDLRANVPYRSLSIVGLEGETSVPLAKEMSRAIGSYQLELDPPAALQLNESRGVLVGIEVGQADPSARSETGGSPSWKIDFARLEIRGKIEPR